MTIGCASGRANGCVAAAAIARPSAAAAAAAARRSAGSASSISAAVAQTFVLISKTEAKSSVFSEPGSVEALDAAQDPVDRGDLAEGLRVEDHQLLLDAERERRGLAEPLLADHDWVCALTPCTGRPAATQA